MPSKSKSQQKFFGIVHGLQKGTVDPEDVSDKAKDVADKIDYDDAEDFAKTKHKGLPDKVKKDKNEQLRDFIKTEIKKVMNESSSLTFKRMEGLATMQALDAFDKSIRIIKKDLLEEGFDKKSIESFLLQKMRKFFY